MLILKNYNPYNAYNPYNPTQMLFDIPCELLGKKVDLIKQLREANGFSANEIALIMNMDECTVIGILQRKEDE